MNRKSSNNPEKPSVLETQTNKEIDSYAQQFAEILVQVIDEQNSDENKNLSKKRDR